MIDIAGSHYDYRITGTGGYRANKAHLYNGTSSVSYRAYRSTKGRTGGKFYAEILIGQEFEDMLVGIYPSTTDITSSFSYPGDASSGYGYYQANGSTYVGDVPSAYGSSYTGGDVVSVAIDTAAGKIWFAKNGTYPGGGDPAAGTGAAYSSLSSSTAYHIAGSIRKGSALISPTFGGVQTIRLASAALSYSPPSGFSPWLPPASVSITVRDESGSTINSTSFKWAFFEETTPDALAVPVATGTNSTSGSGVLAISIPYTSLSNGATGSLLISTTGGTAGVQCRSWYMPVTVTV